MTRKNVWTVTAAGTTAAATGHPCTYGLSGGTGSIISDTHPRIAEWLAAAFITQTAL